jgi:hypothetical protein
MVKKFQGHDVLRGFADAGSQGGSLSLITLVAVQSDSLFGYRCVFQDLE